MNIQGLIERYEKFKANKKKLTSVDLVLKDLRSLDEPEPLPFKLKDVVGRIRGFDPTTKAIWLNTILKELGNDYGLMKYRSGYDQGLLDGAWVGNQLKDADKIRQELNKPVVPHFVANYIERTKEEDYHLLGAMTEIRSHKNKEIDDWFYTDDNIDLFARAWLDGYEEVEEEKRYTVKIIGITNYNSYLNYHKGENKWTIESRMEIDAIRTEHTRKQLEKAGFGWVFDCPGIEIEEVTE